MLLIADVQFHWRNKERLSISLIKREDFGIAGRALYKVISHLNSICKLVIQ